MIKKTSLICFIVSNYFFNSFDNKFKSFTVHRMIFDALIFHVNSYYAILFVALSWQTSNTIIYT